MSSSSSSCCTTFAQNAWKKDLCSNCFRTEAEHNRVVGRKAAASDSCEDLAAGGGDASSSGGSLIAAVDAHKPLGSDITLKCHN